MACGCSSSSDSDPGFCGPPDQTNIIVAGPQGADGKSAYQVWIDAGNVGTELQFLDSLQGTNGTNGATGPTGLTGAKGNTGTQGATGAVGLGSTVGYFTGAQWNPSYPYTNGIIGLTDQRLLSFGTIPFATGRYLLQLNMQIGWNGAAAGTSSQSGNAWLIHRESPSSWQEVMEFFWARNKQGTSGYAYGTVQGYAHSAIVDLVQGRSLELKCGADFFLVGGQLSVFVCPNYIINSAGFVDGTNQKIFDIVPIVTVPIVT